MLLVHCASGVLRPPSNIKSCIHRWRVAVPLRYVDLSRHDVKSVRSRSRCVSVRCTEEGNEGVTLTPVESEAALDSECTWISSQIQSWLDEEWEVLDIHKEVGDEAASILSRLRREGETDLGTVLLSLGAELTSFDFTETYTGPYDVANKVSELLMVRMGMEVCCVSEDDQRRAQS
ncbi:hypothetical protein BSKO_06372 [Bryopsis sp. KO-2023]|nr:hypothetical protein BSKO_06372 [Bryopsis sp. KO-2023]